MFIIVKEVVVVVKMKDVRVLRMRGPLGLQGSRAWKGGRQCSGCGKNVEEQ